MVVGGGARTVCAQAATGTIPAETQAELHALTRLAAVIFAGRVTSVRRLDGSGGATGVVEIEFAVDDAVRGIGGGTYKLREWPGLWAGNEPFRMGQRYLMLLHAPGQAGLSSPVGGSDGAMPIVGGGAGMPTDGMIDLRWIAARVPRPLAYRAEPVGRPVSPVEVRANAMSAGAPEVNLAAPAATAAPASANAGYAGVLGLLRSWEKAGDAAR